MQTTLAKFTIEEAMLNNGATLLYRYVDGAPRMAVSIYLAGGNLRDTVYGLSDIVDRLLLKGTTTRSQEQISEALDGLSLEFDIETKRDYTAVHLTLLEEDLDASLELVTDFIYNATLNDFDREKEKLMGEIAMDLDSPRSRASDQMIKTVFKDTAYSAVSSVILESLPTMTSVEDARSYYQQAFHPKNMLISCTGEISQDKISKKLEAAFSKQTTDYTPIKESVIEAVKGRVISEDAYVSFPKDDSAQAHIFQAWTFPTVKHPDYYPLVVMNTILGAGGLSSRMFLELRDKQGLGYTVRSTYETYRHNALFHLYIGTDPKNKEKCLTGFKTEYEKLMNTPVGVKELVDAKRNILGRRSIMLETAPNQANYIGVNYMVGRSLDDIAQLPEKIKAVTAEDIQRVSQQYFAKPSVISIVGPSSIL